MVFLLSPDSNLEMNIEHVDGGIFDSFMAAEKRGELSDMGLWPFIKNEREENKHEPDCPGTK